MKKFFASVFLLTILGSVIFYHESINRYIIENYIYKKEIVLENANEYEKKQDYIFVQKTRNYQAKNRQDILNIIYNSLNSGWDEFFFYCDDEYDNCIKDSTEIINDSTLLSNINNFVHPYNSFNKMYAEINTLGRVSISVNKLYEEKEIAEIEKKVDTIIKENIDSSMSDEDKIKIIHDYIIEHTSYDENRNEYFEKYQNYQYHSNTAYGSLIEGHAICGGYSDAMAIFLNRLGYNNYKISSKNHVWNLVELNGSWYHIDPTWDDPIIKNGEEIISHSFFLITDKQLKEKKVDDHDYNEKIYLEINQDDKEVK